VLLLCWGAVAQSKDRMMHACCLGMSECIERYYYPGLMVGQKYWNSILVQERNMILNSCRIQFRIQVYLKYFCRIHRSKIARIVSCLLVTECIHVRLKSIYLVYTWAP
jgi:hypothetical protein